MIVASEEAEACVVDVVADSLVVATVAVKVLMLWLLLPMLLVAS